MKKILVLACLMLSSVAFIPSKACASIPPGTGGGPLIGVIIYEHFKAVEVTEIITTINHTYKVIEATTRSGKVIKYAVDEAGNVFYDLNNLPK
ncbi:MAG: hypothetical protein HXK20_05220 [Alloprevotella tannerae]|nr:hypothetical protein [Alloprevotella tannerae]